MMSLDLGAGTVRRRNEGESVISYRHSPQGCMRRMNETKKQKKERLQCMNYLNDGRRK